jgi:hypothetical protein
MLGNRRARVEGKRSPDLASMRGGTCGGNGRKQYLNIYRFHC